MGIIMFLFTIIATPLYYIVNTCHFFQTPKKNGDMRWFIATRSKLSEIILNAIFFLKKKNL